MVREVDLLTGEVSEIRRLIRGLERALEVWTSGGHPLRSFGRWFSMGRKRPIIVVGLSECCFGRGELPWNRDTLGWKALFCVVGM